jgi:hypothetical protein
MVFDPRTISVPVYEALADLRALPGQDTARLKEQKNQAVELYTYLATWGMLRLKAEELALSQQGKKQVVIKFFECLQHLSKQPDLVAANGLNTLKELGTNEYLGLTGLGLSIAREFAFWANALYADVKGGD